MKRNLHQLIIYIFNSVPVQGSSQSGSKGVGINNRTSKLALWLNASIYSGLNYIDNMVCLPSQYEYTYSGEWIDLIKNKIGVILFNLDNYQVPNYIKTNKLNTLDF